MIQFNSFIPTTKINPFIVHVSYLINNNDRPYQADKYYYHTPVMPSSSSSLY